MKGKISKFLSSRGYGFISVEKDEKDIFFHVSKYPVTEIPTQGQLLEFTVDVTPKGKEAVNIKIVKDGSEEEPVEEEEPPKQIVNDLDKLNGVGPKYRELLGKADINSCLQVSGYSPEDLLANLLSVNEKESVTKRPPTLTQVTSWISLAKEVA